VGESAPERGRTVRGRKGRQKLATCFGMLERQELDVTAATFHGDSGVFHTNQTDSIVRKWNRFQAGPTFSTYLTDNIAVGASVHGLLTTYSTLLSASTVTLDDSGHTLSSGLDVSASGHSFDLGAILGMTWHADRHHTLGLSISTPTLHVTGVTDSTLHNQYAGAGDFVTMQQGHGAFYAPSPVRASIGLGAEYGRLKLEADATYYFPLAEAVRAELSVSEVGATNGVARSSRTDTILTERANGVVNTGFGFQYFARPSISVLGGISSDFSPVAPLNGPPTLGSVAYARQSRVAGSLGMGSYGIGGELLFGTEVSYGWGRAYAVNPYVWPNAFTTVDQTQFRILFVIAGSTSLSSLKRTVENLVRR
jgi:hypothetical protein